MRYSRKGLTELSIPKEADDNGHKSKDPGFIPVLLDGSPASGLGVSEIRVRFSNGMELSQSDGDINELIGMIRKMLSYGMIIMTSERADYIRRYFVDALTEDYLLALWFIEDISKIFTIEYECSKAGKTGAARLLRG